MLLLNWFTNSLVYDGFNFNTGYLVGNPYLNFFLSALVELIAVIVEQITVVKFGRKLPYALSMFTVAISMLSIQFIPRGL